MKVRNEKRIKTETTTVNVIVATFSEEELKEILIEHFHKIGVMSKVEDIRFNTSWKYEEDEQGMNKHIVTSLEGFSILLGEGRI